MPEYDTLATVSTPDTGGLRVHGIHHRAQRAEGEARVTRPGEYEVVIEGDLTLDAADPAQRAQLQAIVAALQTAVAHGTAVQVVGETAIDVQPRDSTTWRVEGSHRLLVVTER